MQTAITTTRDSGESPALPASLLADLPQLDAMDLYHLERDYNDLSGKAETYGSREHVNRLLDFLRENPEAFPPDRHAWELAKAIYHRVLGEVPKAAELLHGFTEIKRGLGYDQSPELERRIIELIALSWLRLQVLEHRHAEATEDKRADRRTVLYWDKRLNAAEIRYVRACESLARIRKLKLPNIQINTEVNRGGQQVNVMGIPNP